MKTCFPRLLGTLHPLPAFQRSSCFHSSMPRYHSKLITNDLRPPRARANEVDKMDLVGSVMDSDVVIVDDMIDTAGTLGKAADVLVNSGGTEHDRLLR